MSSSSLRLLALALLLSSMGSSALAQNTPPSASTPVTQLKYGRTGVTDSGNRELLVGPAYGDLAKGQHGSFVRMPAGFVSHVHVHSGDYWGVVVSGVAVNGAPGSADVQLPAGSYWFQKGGEKHVTKCVSPNECLFFISQNGKFDYIVDEARK